VDEYVAAGSLQAAMHVVTHRTSSCPARNEDRRARIAKELALDGETPESLFLRAEEANKRSDARAESVAYERAVDAIEHQLGVSALVMTAKLTEPLAFAPRGSFLGLGDGLFVDVRTGREVWAPESAIVDAEGKVALVPGDRNDGLEQARELLLVDLNSGAKLLHATTTRAVTYDDALGFVGWVEPDGIHLFDVARRVTVTIAAGEGPHALTFVGAPRLAWVDDDGVHVRSADGRLARLVPPPPTPPETVALALSAADGNHVAVAWSASGGGVLALYAGERVVAQRNKTFAVAFDVLVGADPKRARFAWAELDLSPRGRNGLTDAIFVAGPHGPARKLAIPPIVPQQPGSIAWREADSVAFSPGDDLRARYDYDLRGAAKPVLAGGAVVLRSRDACELAKKLHATCDADEANDGLLAFPSGALLRAPSEWTLVDEKSGALRVSLRGSAGSRCTAKSAAVADGLIACKSEDGRPRAWSLATGALVWTGPRPNEDRCVVGARVIPNRACGDPGKRVHILEFGVVPTSD
jgi:hypothetical protein